MKAVRVDEFHKYGCHFHGHLVVVDYTEDLKNDPKMGTWNAGVSFDYVAKAAAYGLDKLDQHLR